MTKITKTICLRCRHEVDEVPHYCPQEYHFPTMTLEEMIDELLKHHPENNQ